MNFSKTLVGAPICFKSLRKEEKVGRYRAETKEGSKKKFKKIEADYCSSSSYVFCIAPLLLTLKEHL
jgi:hypothetical protein